ncbi:MAG: hypothetical protein JSS53_06155, partial [Proteobacteria bacterium]|nr:hypothetical protein [Pseudomonadota bacterium]
MNIKPIVASLALLVSGTAFAGFHGLEEAPSCGVKLAKVQSVIDRNNAPYYAECDWFNRITLSGLVQVNAGYFSRVNGTSGVRFPVGGNLGSSDIWLSRANLYLDADVNSWTTAHIAVGSGGANFTTTGFRA